MASNVSFEDFTIEVKGAMSDAINAKLAECAGEIVSATQRNSRVDTGKTKGSFKYKVVDSEHVAYIGSNDENAIWEEFGTGEHAIKGNGRQGGWFYEDEEGKGHFTHGKKPSRAFWHAYISLKSAIIKHLQDSLKGL